MKSRDLCTISILNYYLTLRQYKTTTWGPRKLGTNRYAFDVGYLSFIVEKYWNDKW